MNTSLLVDPLGGLATNVVVTCNGLFDPFGSLSTVQPRGFDQMGFLFQNYYVEKLHCKATWANKSASTSDTYICGITLRNDATPSTARVDLMESRYCKYKIMGNQDGHTSVAMTVRPANFLGFPKGRNEELMKGSTTANPGQNCFFHVFTAAVGSENPGSIVVVIELTFYTIWTDPVLPPTSVDT